MRFTVPTTTITSVSGAALLVALTSREVAGSVSHPHKRFNASFGAFGAHVKTEGDECSYEKAVRVKEMHLDIGILGTLGCGSGLTCVEDATSSVGGRCVSLVVAEPVIQSVVDVSLPCKYMNGTIGMKCAGSDACSGSNDTRIGCGSCIGDFSCSNLTGYVTIGENSCLGEWSCAADPRRYGESRSVTIGDNSCVYPLSCLGQKGNVTIGENSCSGFNSCKYANGMENPVHIGSNSCHSIELYSGSCKYIEGATIGNSSCIGPVACFHFNGGTIGDGSCYDMGACAAPPGLNYTGNIGDNSCNGDFSCTFYYASRDIGDNSCNGIIACTPVTYDVGNDSCNGDYACPICYPNAQKVKLQSITGKPIQVFEVKAYSSGVNVAEGKTATQSSTFQNKPRFGANNAIDGNAITFSHTVISSSCPSWWEVDLGGLFPIESIDILNRWCHDESDPTACLCRLSHASLALFDDAGRCVESISIGNVCGDLEVKHDFVRSREFCNLNRVVRRVL